MLNYLLLIVICSFVWASPIHAAKKNDIRFDRLSVEHGLPHTSVYDILQDRQGFMWFATDDGVCRYNGYTFTVFKHVPDDPPSISPGGAYSVYEDRSGNIWISIRNGGLSRYDPLTGMFTHYQHDPHNPNSLSHNLLSYDSIYEDSSGIFWFGTLNGLNRFDPAMQSFERYYHDANNPDSLGKGIIRTIQPDPANDKILWIGTNDGGLTRFDRVQASEHEIPIYWLGADGKTHCTRKARRQFVRYEHDESNPNSISHNTVWKIYGELSQEGKSILWLCTAGGLDRFDTATGKFEHFRHEPNNPESLSHNNVYSLIPAGDGTFWVGTNGGGLNRFDPVRKTFVSYQTGKNPQTISSSVIHPLYYDRSGTLWIGTWGGGVSRIDPLNQKTRLYDENSGLTHSGVLSLYEDSKGIIWIGTWSGGINRFDPETGTFEHFRHDPENHESLGNDVVSCFYEDSEGLLWVGTWGGGLNRFDRETKRFTRYEYRPDNPESISNSSVRGICEDDSGSLWIATTSGGVNRFDRKSKKFTRYLYDADNPDGISTNNIWSAFKDSSGTLWFTSSTGLNRFDPVREKFIQYHHDKNDSFGISSDGVINVYEDSQKRLWITTEFGLNRFDKNTGRFIRYFEADGLPDNRVESITEDNDGNLWLGTGKGLCRFDPETNKTTTYGLGDGMQSNLFFYPAAIKSRNGELWFGGPKGLNVFDPRKFTDNPHKPAVVLTDFQIDGKSVHAGEHSVLKEDISMVREIMITPDISKFGFEFSALNYTVSEKNRYACKMEGFDKDWVNTGSDRRFAHYTNLDPGEYIFRVKGSNNDGLWNEQGAAVKIIILPPWWKTSGFRISLIAVLTALLFGAYRWRINSVEALNRELELQVAERTQSLTHEIAERRRAEETLRKSQSLLNKTGRMAKVGGWEFDSETLKQVWTEEVYLIHEVDRNFEPTVSKGIEFYAPEFRPLIEKAVRRAISHGEAFDLKLQFITAKGNLRWVHAVGNAHHENGKIVRVSGTFQDITEQKSAEDALRESEERFRTIFEKSPISIELYDAEGRLLHVNRACLNIFGISEAESLRNLNLFENPNFKRPESDQVMKGESVRLEIPYDFEQVRKIKWFTTSKSGIMYADALITPLRNEQKRIFGYMVQIQDITERKLAEMTLRKNERLMSDIINFLPDATFVIDKKGKVLAWNNSLETMTGIKAEEILGKGDYEYAMPFYGKRRQILIDLVLQPKEDIEKTYCQIQRAGDKMTAEHYYPNLQGKQTWLFGNASVLRNSEGDIIGAIESVRDITDKKNAEIELKKAKEAAEAANQAKSGFLANMSHELRTPLNSILGFTRILARSSHSNEEEEYFGIIQRSGEHLLTLINQVLDLSKIEAGQVTLNEKDFDLHRLLDDLKDMFSLRAGDKGLQVVFEYAADVPRVIRGDEVKLRQVLINLLNNAVKFTEKGSIALRAGTAAGQAAGLPLLTFEIGDTGPGIAADELDTVFEAFVQTETGRQALEGTGLGLPISREFVQLMGGDIAVQSEAGKGSVFGFHIRAKFGDTSEIRDERKTAGWVKPAIARLIGLDPGQPRFRVLIADDNDDNRRLFVSLLRPLGFDLREAVNGQEAAEVWQTWRPDMIFMDMRMPVKDGYAATQAIRSMPQGHETKIILVSASSFEDERATALSQGCDDFLRKPFREYDLFDMIRSHLGATDPASAFFVYEKTAEGQNESESDSEQIRAAFRDIPPELLIELIRAAEQIDFTLMLTIIEKIGGYNRSASDALGKMANDFEYEKIMELLRV